MICSIFQEKIGHFALSQLGWENEKISHTFLCFSFESVHEYNIVWEYRRMQNDVRKLLMKISCEKLLRWQFLNIIFDSSPSNIGPRIFCSNGTMMTKNYARARFQEEKNTFPERFKKSHK